MYINQGGNVFCVCTAVTKPTYKEESGEKRVELAYLNAKCREASPEGTQTVSLDLLFYGTAAIPAMKIAPGHTLVIAGRESSKEAFAWGKHKLNRTVIVDWWGFREIDPGGILDELKARREIFTREREFREMFAEFLTEAKPSIIKWIMDYSKEMREANSNDKGSENG